MVGVMNKVAACCMVDTDMALSFDSQNLRQIFEECDTDLCAVQAPRTSTQ